MEEMTKGGGGSRVRDVVYLHGFLSSGMSTKAEFFRERFEDRADVAFHAIDFNPTPRDFETMTTTGQINRLRQFLLDRELADVGLIGSSFGGLIALRYAHRFGGVTRLLLLAPGLRWLSGGLSEEELARWETEGVVRLHHPAFDREVPVRYDLHEDGLRYVETVAPPAPMVIVHGRGDRTVPIADSRAYAEAYGDQVRLIEVEAGHDLNEHLGLVWEVVEGFLVGGGAPGDLAGS